MGVVVAVSFLVMIVFRRVETENSNERVWGGVETLVTAGAWRGVKDCYVINRSPGV